MVFDKVRKMAETDHSHTTNDVSSTEAVRVSEVCYQIRSDRLATILAGMPMFALFVCLTVSIIFMHEKVIELECGAINIIPSISAITGVYPVHAIWKASVALQSAPRIAVGFMYYNFYWRQLHHIKKRRSLYQKLVVLNTWLYICDNAGLIGISYMTNRDNYWIHEKIFIVFLAGAVGYNVLTCFLWHWLHQHKPWTPDLRKSYIIKVVCTVAVVLSLIGLLYFFYWHKVHCLDGAFSRFCICEYFITVLNMAFHYTAVLDFPSHQVLIGKVVGRRDHQS